MIWPWGKKKDAAPKYPTLRAVADSRWLAEYRGQVNSGGETKYFLWLCKITPAERIALLDKGFRGIAGKWPTHWIECRHKRPYDTGQLRPLFIIVLGFDGIVRPAQDKAAREVTRILRRSLEQCKEPRFVIRKNTRLEFPWPQDDGQLEGYWLTEATVAYRSVMRQMERLGLTVDSATVIQ